MATDATASADLTDDLYPVVYQAMRDALWDVIGTAVYALFLIAVFAIGAWFALVFGLSGGFVLVPIAGALLALAAAVQFLRLFDLFPFG